MRRQTSKYKAKPTVIDGIRFHSQKEARRYQELKLLEKAGEIRGLTIQPEYGLCVFTNQLGKYVGDFAYEERHEVPVHDGLNRWRWRSVVEDVKGVKTPLYKWKKKHVEAQYGIQIREV